MGLDIILFNKNNIKVGAYEITTILHNAIFVNTSIWGSYLYLRKIKDYYKTNVKFQNEDLETFVFELKQILSYVSPSNSPALQQLIDILSEESVYKIHISGD